jgi:DnaJ family protein A protein 5
MGASQSSGAGATAVGSSVEVKTSYYELLGVERTASDDEYAPSSLKHRSGSTSC